MYNRKIDMYYYFEGESEVEFTLVEVNYAHAQCYSFNYKVKDYNYWTELYNKLLDDFDAEYDDKLANLIESLVAQFWKEKELCDSATQE